MTTLFNQPEIKLSHLTDKINNIRIDSLEHDHSLFNLMQVYDLIDNTLNVSIDDVAMPTSDQFKLDHKFKTIRPKDSSKKYYLGNCGRCGLALRYLRGQDCIVCSKKRQLSSIIDRDHNLIKSTKVYFITQIDIDEVIYIGSTTMKIERRISGHKSESKRYPDRKLYRYVSDHGGWSNFTFKVVFISEVPKDSTDEFIAFKDAEIRYFELKYIDELKPKCNQNQPIDRRSYSATELLMKMISSSY